VEGVFGLLAVEDLLDGQNLEPGVCCAVHGFGGFFEAEEDADLGFAPFQVSELGLGPADHPSTLFFFKWSNSVSTRSCLALSNQARQMPRLSDQTSFGVAATGWRISMRRMFAGRGSSHDATV